MIKINSKGDFKNTKEYFSKSVKATRLIDIEQVAQKCIKRLQRVTPKDSGLTAESWYYESKRERNKVSITICNSNIQNGYNVVFLLEYGHAAVDGSWVSGRNFVEPVVQRLYDQVIKDTKEELRNLC